MVVSLVTLNYRDYEGSKQVYEQAVKIKAIDHIIIVDNKSGDGSFEKLRNELQGREKVEIIQTGNNGGYSAGYNFGFKYCEKYSSEFVFLCNSDVIFNEDLVNRCLDFLKNNPQCGAVSGRMKNIEGKEAVSAWDFPRYRDDLLFCFWSMRKFVLPKIKKNLSLKGKTQVVDSLAGSFTCYRVEALKNAGYYDEKVFLYNEENIMAQRMRISGYYSVRVNDVFYIHAHHRKSNVRTSFKYLLKRNMSGLYYHNIYGKISPSKAFLYKACIYYYSAEEYLIGIVKSLLKKER